MAKKLSTFHSSSILYVPTYTWDERKPLNPEPGRDEKSWKWRGGTNGRGECN